MKYLYVYGGAIGDTLLGIHLGRTLSLNNPQTQLILVSTRKNDFARELTATIPFVQYIELQKRHFSSWIMLARMMSKPWKSVIYDPFASPVSFWWKIILWSASRYPGSIIVRCQIRPKPIPSYARAVVYDCKKDNLFDTPRRVLEAWGIEVHNTPHPSLSAPACSAPVSGRYIVFHFLAGVYRRSVPAAHARDILLSARAQFPHHIFVVTCSSEEYARTEKIVDGIANIIIKPGLPAQDILCLLSHASLCVGVASGITHVAAHLDVPSVVLCNLSDPCWLPTYNPKVVLLAERARCKCNGDKTGECAEITPQGAVYCCLYDIKTESVIDAMKRLDVNKKI